MAKGSAFRSSRLACDMISCSRRCASALRSGAKMKPMPPPDMPPSIQKPQKSSPKASAGPLDERLGVEVAGPGDDRLDGLAEVRAWWPPRWPGRRPSGERRGSRRRMPPHAAARRPLRLAAQQVFLGHHLQDRADVLGHAAVDEDQALLQQPRGSAATRPPGRGSGGSGSRRPRLTPNSGSPSPAGDAADELHARPDAAGVLPAAAGAAEPFAEDRAGERPAALAPPRAAARRASGPGRWRACSADQRGQQVGGDGQARALGDVVDRADQLQAAARADDPRQQVAPGSAPSPRARAARCPRR